jgi:hypothetical protein
MENFEFIKTIVGTTIFFPYVNASVKKTVALDVV